MGNLKVSSVKWKTNTVLLVHEMNFRIIFIFLKEKKSVVSYTDVCSRFVICLQ